MDRKQAPVPSPKRSRLKTEESSAWYQYYAGYSQAFVTKMVDEIGYSRSSVILDPWNGIGTTTSVALKKGLPAIGFDINPVVVLIAKARRLTSGVSQSLGSLASEIVGEAGRVQRSECPEDPLETWFSPATSFTLRAMERSIQKLLVSSDSDLPIFGASSLGHISDLAAFFFTALFRVVRELVRPFGTSNPTWFKFTGIKHRICIDESSLMRRFERSVQYMQPGLRISQAETTPDSRIDLASSIQLPLKRDSVSMIVTSPPYCTRIDYAVTTAPELALLGMEIGSDLKTFRAKMLGTSTIGERIPRQSKQWGYECNSFLDQVQRHKSKAATSYYLKTHLQYFDGLSKSLREIERVLKPKGVAAIVVQDSYFKNLHIDLPKITTEMGEKVGLITINLINYVSNKSMRSVNTGSRRYRESAETTESVVILKKR